MSRQVPIFSSVFLAQIISALALPFVFVAIALFFGIKVTWRVTKPVVIAGKERFPS